MILALVACNTSNKRVHTVYDKNYIPVNVVPKPPLVTRPTLLIHKLSEEDLKKDGELVKAYKVSLHQLMEYAKTLELVYNKYNDLSVASNDLFDILKKYNTNSQPPLTMSANPNGDTSEIVERASTPDFNFEHEYQKWKMEKDLENLQEEINILNEKIYDMEDEFNVEGI